LRDADDEAYKRQFSDYIKEGIEPEHIEAMWTKAHAAIRQNPVYVPTQKPANPVHKSYKAKPKNLKQRKDRIKQKLAALQKAAVVL